MAQAFPPRVPFANVLKNGQVQQEVAAVLQCNEGTALPVAAQYPVEK
jgi:hypothetical protein